ncbi:hypothetical protein JCM14036_10300 [Desulfotomaculum defluvii]
MPGHPGFLAFYKGITPGKYLREIFIKDFLQDITTENLNSVYRHVVFFHRVMDMDTKDTLNEHSQELLNNVR